MNSFNTVVSDRTLVAKTEEACKGFLKQIGKGVSCLWFPQGNKSPLPV